ncbi:hypothetical protein D3C86_1535750 [compost metagenome]
MQIGNIILRDHNGGADRDLRRPAAILHLFVALHFGNRLFKHLLVKLEADFLDMAGLFFAEQIACAANIEVVARQLETGAERVERLQHLQPPLRHRRQHLVDRQGEERKGTHL